jgi:hypothetical protein
MRQNILLMAVVLLSISGIIYAQAPLESNYSTGFVTDWLPIIAIAIMAAISLIAVYYFIGVLLNNTRIKGTAISEMQQVLGTILLVVIILGVMSLIGAGTSLSYKGGIGTGEAAQISSICNNILVNSQEGFLNSAATSANFPSPYPNLPQPTNAVCQIVNGHGSVDPVTSNIDYGLAASYVVIANLTNQSIVELNGLYNIDSLIFFLRQVITYADICDPVTCIIAPLPREGETVVYYKLYSGYVFQRTILPTMDTQANLSIYLFMTQLILILTLLITWPYLLAAGIMLRVFAITRRAGGLIIAAVIVGTIIYPMLFLFQYTALQNLVPPGAPLAPHNASALQALGATGQIPYVPLCGISMNTPTLSGYTRGYGGNPDATSFQLWCYTSAPKLKTSYIYQNTQPSGAPATLSACGVRNPSFAPPASDPQIPTGVTAPCYVQKDYNFYVFPSTSDVIRLYTCYPPDYGSPQHIANDGTLSPYGIIDIEVRIINSLNIESPITILLTISNLVSNLFPGTTSQSGLSTFTPFTHISSLLVPNNLPCSIAPQNMIAALTQLINLYGMISVVGFILPVINILTLLSATFGLSSLMGGETSIIGLSRFI